MTVNQEDPEDWIASQKSKLFEEFRESEVVGDHCESCQYEPDPVIKRGSLDASVMVVGPYPGRTDDSDVPFGGELEELLDRMLKAVSLDPQKNCYITTALLCGKDQDQIKTESIESCYKNLHRQIEIVDPQVILGTGRIPLASMYRMSPEDLDTGQLGYRGSLPDFPWIEGVVTIDPIHILKAGDGTDEQRKYKEIAWEHLKKVKELSNLEDQD